ncbi:MAG TPA: phospho-N-acetylmuramoyl-pentapeptide-transferase [Opitutae bacterium]|nr:phospho-N-acetylmuramoyl-pentapeptide-transferase [Puniceicoccaceae bacterium]HAU59357.1 phospho-N-acetylmuramoyl-pentapeptide-transferase [Opitutae bacterium]HCY58103.1 phospho-N-acetylmuramoyl-pentapeptide-transferase [Opitutae bacterium]|tara:strand:+ start:15968 stop:17104 length:1137 start_codon:yes stop_codon:yes gene_type:complete
MLSYLQFYEETFGPLRLFQFISVRAIIAGITAMLIGFFIGPRLIRFLQDFGARQAFRDKDEVGDLAELHKAKEKTPTMGGLLIFFSVVVSTILCAEPNIYVVAALVTYSLLTIVGFTDDYLKISKKNSKGLSGRYKLLGQLLSTGVLLFMILGPLSEVLTGLNEGAIGSADKMRELWVPFFKDPIYIGMPILLVFLFFLITLTGSSNAINLTDGLDGLAIGCTVTVALTYGIMAYASGNYIISEYLKISWIPGSGELTILCAALLGGSLSFLWYNAHPAEMFMGDTGSLAIGGLVGAIALMVHQPLTLIIVGGIFVMEAGSVILQVASFKSRGKRIFLMSPIHHHFELKGWKETKVVIRFWILSLLFALVGLATLKLR